MWDNLPQAKIRALVARMAAINTLIIEHEGRNDFHRQYLDFGGVESQFKGVFGCNLEASDSVQNGVDLELQSDSKATVRLNSSST